MMGRPSIYRIALFTNSYVPVPNCRCLAIWQVLTVSWLVLAFCAPDGMAETRFQLFALRRQDYKVRITAPVQITEVLSSSLTRCLAACAHTNDCQAWSFKERTQQCVMAVANSSFSAEILSYTRHTIGWITMAKSIFTVYELRGPLGFNSVLFENASALCEGEGTSLASPQDLLESKSRGLHTCTCGWTTDGRNALSIQFSDCGQTASSGLTYCDRTSANVWCLL